MAAAFTDILMSLGQGQVDVDWDPEVWDAVAEGAHLQLYEGQRLAETLVVLNPSPGRAGIVLPLVSLEHHLGADNIGPLVEFREYISGRNMLWNGDFGESLIYWETDQDSGWVWRPESHTGGTGSAYVETSSDGDDPLRSKTYTVVAGQQYFAFGWVLRGPGDVGRIRLRTIYTGRFRHPDLASAYSAWGPPVRDDIELMTDPAGIVEGPVFRCMTDMPNLIPDFEFDGGVPSSDWDDLSGVWGQGTDGGWNGDNYAYTDVDAGIGHAVLQSLTPISCVPGEEYEMRIVIRPNPGSPDTDGEAWMEVALSDDGSPPYVRIATKSLRGPMSTTDWNILIERFAVPDGQVSMTPLLYRSGGATGRWDYDTPTVFRFKGNYDQRIGPAIAGTAGRTYRWRVPYRVDSTVTSGRAQLRAALYGGPGRPVIHLDGPDLRGAQLQQADPLQHAEFDITLPSGYDAFEPRLYCEDVIGGPIYVGQGTIVDADASTLVYDQVSLPTQYPDWLLLQQVTVVPAGAETIHVAAVAEQYGNGWLVDDLTLVRFGEPLATAGAIVADCLVHPQTGLPILLPGVIHAAGVIQSDWQVRNLTNRDVLRHLSRVGQVLPAREWFVDAEARLHWGLPAQLFTDHTNIILGPDDFFLLGPAEVTATTEDQTTDTKVIGAGEIVGRATNPPGEALDYMGNPIYRTQVVEDSTVDQLRIADPYAEYLAAKAAGVTNVKIRLSDPRALGLIRKGDWLYLWDDMTLVDPTREVALPDGRRVNPVRKRVLSVTTRYGGGSWSAKLRRPDGTLMDISPRWEPETVVEMELGEMLPEFAIGPEGGSASQAFLKFRASAPT